MVSLIKILFEQYNSYSSLDVFLEITAVVFGISSVIFSKKNNFLVFPTGMISTSIFVYLLIKWELLGDTLINAYYFFMSIYGWQIWVKKKNNTNLIPLSHTNKSEKKTMTILFITSLVSVYLIYIYFNKWNSWTAYVDTLTTAIFFTGMWLMANRKIENWIFWIIGDIISVPLYFYKGLAFTAFQYIIFTIIAIWGYKAWQKEIQKKIALC
jgi:nicotinamide mononucleotide transporter